MKRTFRRVRGRHGVAARRVAVHVPQPWYRRALMVCALVGVGYALGYWHFSRSEQSTVMPEPEQAQSKALITQLVLSERQLQVERAAQSGAAKEMAALQDEIMRLKEDVAFYESILAESGSSGVPRLHSVKLVKGSHPGEYQYHILLVQSGRHDKVVRGTLRLMLQATQDGKAVTRHVESAGQQQSIMVNFKYYQRLDGTFSIPVAVQGQSLLVEFLESGGRQPKLTEAVNLPS